MSRDLVLGERVDDVAQEGAERLEGLAPDLGAPAVEHGPVGPSAADGRHGGEE
jgi:hypothetical protein